MLISVTVIFTYAIFVLHLTQRINHPVASALDVQLAILAVFGIGYYCLPFFFPDASRLYVFDEFQISAAIFLHILYFFVFAISAKILYQASASVVARSDPLDLIFKRHFFFIYVVCYALYLYYFFSNDLTSYSALNRDQFLIGARDAVSSIVSAYSGFALAGVCWATAYAFSMKNYRAGAFMLSGVLLLSFIAISLAQRLAILSPIITMIGAFAVFRNIGAIKRMFAIGIVTLAVVSPIAVFLRSSQITGYGISAAVDSVQFGTDPIATSFNSILTRSDLIRNTIVLMDYIDRNGYFGPGFYYSVLVSPIPRVVIGEKPYALSDDGTFWGETSALAWRISQSGVGSLTAFGAIVAYREGGWLAVLIDGALLGAFFAFMARRYSDGSVLRAVFFISLFTAHSVRKVPPSFLEALSGYLPAMVSFFILSWLLRAFLGLVRGRQ